MSSNSYLIKTYQGSYNDDLFYNIYSSKEMSMFSRDTFLQIVRIIRRYPIGKGNYILDEKGNTPHEISAMLRDPMGQLYEGKIVKLLVGQVNIYEVRINLSGRRERILFYVKKSSSINEIVFSFYFDKSKVGDRTNILAKETQMIYNTPSLIVELAVIEEK